ncbi:MAG: hypothetical protein ACRBDI_10070 [Alphaproteobacteria bacterium]
MTDNTDKSLAKSAELKDSFNDSGNFTPAIKTDLNGPVTSLKALTNNDIGKDGIPEWDRLTGIHVIHLDQETLTKIANDFARKTSESGMSDIIYDKTDPNFDHEKLQISYQSNKMFVIEAYKEHSPDIINILEKQNIERGYTNDDMMCFTLFDMMRRAGSLSAGAINVSDQAIVITPPKETPTRQLAAGIMGLNEKDLPPEIVGTTEEWHAYFILHELEHLKKQSEGKLTLNSEGQPNFNRLSLHTLNELDSDITSNTLLKPLSNQAFIDYTHDARIIGTINNLVLSQNQKDNLSYQADAYKHAIGFALLSTDDFDTQEEMKEHLKDLDGFVTKIREENVIYHDQELERDEQLSLEDIANTTAELISANIVAEIINKNTPSSTIEKPLTEDEFEIATQLLKSLNDTGFTDHWNKDNAPQIDPTSSASNENTIQAPLIKP